MGRRVLWIWAFLSRSFLGIGLVFSETLHSVRGPCGVVHDRAGFFGGRFLALELEKMGQKWFFLNLLVNLVMAFFQNLIYKESLYCCFLVQIPYLGKIWFLRYWPKCSSTNQIAEFLNHYVSRTKRWKSLILCMLIQIHGNQKKIETYWFGHGQKWVWPVWSKDSKIGWI